MSQLVGSPCAKCQKVIPSILAGEFCNECGNPVHKACKSGTSGSAGACPSCGCAIVSQKAGSSAVASAARPLHVNKLTTKLLVGGSACVICGIWWLCDGLAGGFVNEIIGGLVWKGPLLTAAGCGAAYYGFRLMTDPGPRDSRETKT